MDNKKFGIYVHIPFCVAKCHYCGFISKCANEDEILLYINFLCDEIKNMAMFYENKKVSSVYIGGGTPSFIHEKHIERILKTIYDNYNVDAGVEISIECNPCSTTKEKLTAYKRAGINRISFGVQSLCDDELKMLGRKHTKEQAKEIIKIAKEVGFKNISADVMIGIPNQTKLSLKKTIIELANLNLTHISAYMLIQEEGTLLCTKIQNGEISVASDDECVDMYNIAVEKLDELGFCRYEISNFAKSGYECRHNQNYWELGEYIGFGVASHSFIGDARFSNSENLEEYYKSVSNLKNDIKNAKNDEKTSNDARFLSNYYKNYEILSKKEQIEELIMLGLRTKRGVSIGKLNELGYNILLEKKHEIKMLENSKLIKIENAFIKLTNKSFGLCSAVVLELI